MHSRHSVSTSNDEELARQLQQAETGDIPCKYWRQGYCRNGSNCLYSHAEAPGLGTRRPQQQQQQQQGQAQQWNISTRAGTPPPPPQRHGSGSGGFAVAQHQHGAGDHGQHHRHQHAHQHQQQAGGRHRRQRHGNQENAGMYLPDVDNLTYEQLLELEEKMGSVKIGLRPDQINRIPTTTVRTPPPRSADPCSICLEKINIGDTIRSLPCDHTFHVECIDEWLKEHRQCPVCKRDVTLVASSVGEVLNKMLKS